jgi:Bacterial toxin 44
MAHPTGQSETGRRASAACLCDQRGVTFVQSLILLGVLALGGTAAFNTLGERVSDRAECAGEAVATLGAGGVRCAESRAAPLASIPEAPTSGGGAAPGEAPVADPDDPAPGGTAGPKQPDPDPGGTAGPKQPDPDPDKPDEPNEPEIDFGDVPQVDHTARPAPPVSSEAEEWNAVTDYIAGEVALNVNSPQVAAIRAGNGPCPLFGPVLPLPGVCGAVEDLLPDNLTPGKAAAYALWIERVGPGRPWDHKGAIQNAYGLSTPLPGKEGEISWDVWSNIHYGIVGRHAGFSTNELHAGADAADILAGHGPSAGDQLAIQIGIELYDQFGPNVTAEQIRQAVLDHYEQFGEAGKVYGDPSYLPEGWETPYSREGD